MNSRKSLYFAIILSFISAPSFAQNTDELTLETAQAMRGEESMQAVQNAAERGLEIRRARAQQRHKRSAKTGALSGKRIMLSPGHGIKRDTDDAGNGYWRWQREVTYLVREDLTTYEWMNDWVRPMIERAGAETIMPRASGYADEQHIVTDYETTGTWNGGSNGSYRSATTSSEETATATWTFQVEKSGVYPVYARYYTSDNRTTAAQYTIHHERGESMRFEDQTAMRVKSASDSTLTSDIATTYNNIWHFMGKYPFKAGKTYAIVLSNQSADVGKAVIADAVMIGEGAGTIQAAVTQKTSGYLRWQESALAWLEYLGLPSWVLPNDVSSRSLYSLYEGVDAQFSLHTNAGTGNARGTTTWVWFPTTTGGDQQWVSESQWNATSGTGWSPTTGSDYASEMLPPGTYDFAKHIHARFGDYLKKYWDASWTIASGLSACNFGEIRPARTAWYNNRSKSSAIVIPSTLMEAAYHDNASDASVLRDQKFRFYGARGILVGMIQHFAGTDDVQVPPLPPKSLAVTANGDHLDVSWQENPDLVMANSSAQKYHLYTSSDGLLFDVDPLLTVTTTHAEIPIAKGETLYIRVTAANDAGESLDSKVVAGRLPNLNQKTVLYVDGIDREIKTAYDPNNDREYARIYAPAMSCLNPMFGFDTVDDDVLAAQLQKKTYDLILWSTSETSIDTDVLNAEQRDIVRQLRTAQTPLLISGAELGYALSAASYNSDTTFLADAFDAVYESDSAYPSLKTSSHALDTSVPMTLQVNDFTGATFSFSGCIDNGAKVGSDLPDAECIEYPDTYSATNDGTLVLQYGSGAGAAILTRDGKAILAGFPLESVADPATRQLLLRNLAAKLLGEPLDVSGTCASYVADAEICDNAIDDDGDGTIDCDDSDCQNDASCRDDATDDAPDEASHASEDCAIHAQKPHFPAMIALCASLFGLVMTRLRRRKN